MLIECKKSKHHGFHRSSECCPNCDPAPAAPPAPAFVDDLGLIRAVGADLDAIGAIYGLSRAGLVWSGYYGAAETDSAFRSRIREARDSPIRNLWTAHTPAARIAWLVGPDGARWVST